MTAADGRTDASGAPDERGVVQLGEVGAHWWGRDPADAEVGILAVHGRDQTVDFMTAVLDRLPANLPPVTALLPQSPKRSWYPQRFVAPIEDNQPWLDEALATMVRALEALDAVGLPREKVVLLGFSQGSCLLSTLLLSEPAAAGTAGAALFAGGYVGPEGMPAPDSGGRHDGLPVRLALADSDPWAPVYRSEETAEALRERGADVRLDVRPGDDHVVTDEQVASLADLVRGAAGA